MGFGNLAMLGWLAAAAAPLVIHLWSRWRYREVPWAAIEFLRAALRKNARRIRLRQWLLLAIRTVLILSVVLAMAEPYAQLPAAVGRSAAPAHRIIVIDGSYSMGFRPTAQSLFSRAQSLATELANSGGAADTYSLILMADPPRTVISQPTLDQSLVKAEIARLEVTHGGAGASATLALVDECLTQSDSSHTRWSRQEVYFFTDLGRTSWQPTRTPALEGMDAQDIQGSDSLKEQIQTLSNKAEIAVIDVGAQPADNLAVVQLQVTPTLATTGAAAEVRATIASFSERRADEIPVELLIDGAPVASRRVNIAAGAETSVSFPHRFSVAGQRQVEVRIADDRLTLDNRRPAIVTVKDELPVLCVAGQQGAADYVARALDPQWPKRSEGSALRPRVVTDGELVFLDLSEYHCIFLCNVAQITADEVALLERYVRQGGGLILFLGDQVLPDVYNQFASTAEVRKLLPARIGVLVSEPSYGLDPLDYRHPIVEPFRGRERAGLLTTPVSRYFRLEIPSARTDIETALALVGGDPFVVGGSLAGGRVLLVATAASLSSTDPVTGQPWTMMPAWPSFLPIVREMLAYAGGGISREHTVRVGEVLVGDTTDVEIRDAIVKRPDGRMDSASIEVSFEGRQWMYERTDIQGVYEIGSWPEAELFAVSLDPAESDLSRADVSSLPSELVVRRDTAAPHDDSQEVDFVHRAGFHQWLIYAALLLALAEVYFAWSFGRGAA